jgi:hypothetical protein
VNPLRPYGIGHTWVQKKSKVRYHRGAVPTIDCDLLLQSPARGKVLSMSSVDFDSTVGCVAHRRLVALQGLLLSFLPTPSLRTTARLPLAAYGLAPSSFST